MDEINKILEEIKNDPKAMQSIHDAQKARQEGQVKTWTQVKKELGL